jgi:hypothetical protein
MSRYAFDLDGTLDVPVLARLAEDLFKAGHEIHVVTGGITDTGEWTLPARQEKLARLGVPYTEIHRCFGENLDEIGRKKREVCDKVGALVLFDDSVPYMQNFGGGGAQRLLVLPR